MREMSNARRDEIEEIERRDREARDSVNSGQQATAMRSRPNVGIMLRDEANRLRQKADAFDHLAKMSEIGTDVEQSLFELFMARR